MHTQRVINYININNGTKRTFKWIEDQVGSLFQSLITKTINSQEDTAWESLHWRKIALFIILGRVQWHCFPTFPPRVWAFSKSCTLRVVSQTVAFWVSPTNRHPKPNNPKKCKSFPELYGCVSGFSGTCRNIHIWFSSIRGLIPFWHKNSVGDSKSVCVFVKTKQIRARHKFPCPRVKKLHRCKGTGVNQMIT